MTTHKKTVLKTFWLSFARPHETYVVLTDAEDSNAAIAKAIPLKNFNPHEWALEVYEVPADGEEVRDFTKDVLITQDELRSKGYLKPSEQRALRESN